MTIANQESSESTLEDRFSHLLEWDLDLVPARECARKLSASPLAGPAQSLIANIENIVCLRQMPYVAAAMGVKDFLWAVQYIRGCLGEPLKGRWPFTTDEETLLVRANELFREYLGKAGVGEWAAAIERVLIQALGDTEFQRSARVLLLTIGTLLWTSYECLCKDVWIAALDSGNTKRGQSALLSLAADNISDGIARKAIEVGVLARHEFDLRNCLGTVLVSKFKFSDPGHIERAYVAAFGESDELANIFRRQQLKRLAALRHLIAHRGGVIDEKYRRETASSQTVGEPVAIDTSMVASFAQSVIESSVGLLTQIDARLRG